MQSNNIIYRTRTADENKILVHLKECAGNFIPPLTERIDIAEYAKKLAEKAVTFEAWHERFLAGLIAAYFNPSDGVAFITNVSVSTRFMGAGIAVTLLSNCVSYSKDNNIKTIKLEVNKEATPAIGLYKRFHFLEESTNDNSLFMKLDI